MEIGDGDVVFYNTEIDPDHVVPAREETLVKSHLNAQN